MQFADALLPRTLLRQCPYCCLCQPTCQVRAQRPHNLPSQHRAKGLHQRCSSSSSKAAGEQMAFLVSRVAPTQHCLHSVGFSMCSSRPWDVPDNSMQRGRCLSPCSETADCCLLANAQPTRRQLQRNNVNLTAATAASRAPASYSSALTSCELAAKPGHQGSSGRHSQLLHDACSEASTHALHPAHHAAGTSATTHCREVSPSYAQHYNIL